MRYCELIESRVDELFNMTPEFDIVRNSSDMFVTEAVINGRTIRVMAEYMPSSHSDKLSWDLVFYEEQDANSTYSRVFSATGSGGEKAVFSMVLASIELFLKKHDPDVVNFAADNDGTRNSRATLYRHMLKRFTPMGYEAHENTSSFGINFWLEKVV